MFDTFSSDITMQQQIWSNKTEAKFAKFWLCYGLVGNISPTQIWRALNAHTQICPAFNAHTQICWALDAHTQICWASNTHICMGEDNFLWFLCSMFLSLSPHSHAFIRTFVKLNVYVPTTIAPLETYSLNLITPDHAWDIVACF
jgi:hypothetical protein